MRASRYSSLSSAQGFRHLAYLRRAGLVNVRKDGLWAYYSLKPASNPFHAKLLECLAACCAHVPGATSVMLERVSTKCCE